MCMCVCMFAQWHHVHCLHHWNCTFSVVVCLAVCVPVWREPAVASMGLPLPRCFSHLPSLALWGTLWGFTLPSQTRKSQSCETNHPLGGLCGAHTTPSCSISCSSILLSFSAGKNLKAELPAKSDFHLLAISSHIDPFACLFTHLSLILISKISIFSLHLINVPFPSFPSAFHPFHAHLPVFLTNWSYWRSHNTYAHVSMGGALMLWHFHQLSESIWGWWF